MHVFLEMGCQVSNYLYDIGYDNGYSHGTWEGHCEFGTEKRCKNNRETMGYSCKSYFLGYNQGYNDGIQQARMREKHRTGMKLVGRIHC